MITSSDKRTIPIALAFDRNFILPAQITLYSILKNKNTNTFYDIYVLTSDEQVKNLLDIGKLQKIFDGFRVSIVDVGDYFKNSYEIRGITNAAYNRLLIPQLLPEIEKIIYLDTDMIVQCELDSIYNIDLNGAYVAGFKDYWISLMGKMYQKKIGIDTDTYLQSGFLLMDCVSMRENNICEKFLMHKDKKYEYQDQDILNIVCCGKTTVLPDKDNILLQFYDYIKYVPNYVGIEQQQYMLNNGIIHYNGKKPWKQPVMHDHIWWTYYVESPYFNAETYGRFQHDKYYPKLSIYQRLLRFIRNRIIRK